MFHVLCLIAFSHALPTTLYTDSSFYDDFKPVAIADFPTDPDPSFNFGEQGAFVNMEVDGVAAEVQKKREKTPFAKKIRKDVPIFEDKAIPMADAKVFSDVKDYDFTQQAQPGKAPQLQGSVPDASGDELFNFGEDSAAVTNPAATYLKGGNFDEMPAPKCRMIGCAGPFPNDGSLHVDSPSDFEGNEVCHQTFVPMNGCTDNKGYPMGMLCSICCECTSKFVTEMKNTFGYQTGFST